MVLRKYIPAIIIGNPFNNTISILKKLLFKLSSFAIISVYWSGTCLRYCRLRSSLCSLCHNYNTIIAIVIIANTAPIVSYNKSFVEKMLPGTPVLSNCLVPK